MSSSINLNDLIVKW